LIEEMLNEKLMRTLIIIFDKAKELLEEVRNLREKKMKQLL